MLEARTLGVSIPLPWQEVYGRIWRPEHFPAWASGLAEAGLVPDGDGWQARGPDGPVRILFTPHNAFGIMDHVVETRSGPVTVPMRVVANGEGAEVLITLFRQPAMDDAAFGRDLEWVRRDLERLRDGLLGDQTAR